MKKLRLIGLVFCLLAPALSTLAEPAPVTVPSPPTHPKNWWIAYPFTLPSVYVSHQNQGSYGPNPTTEVWNDPPNPPAVFVCYRLIVCATTFLTDRADFTSDWSVDAIGRGSAVTNSPFGVQGGGDDLPLLNKIPMARLLTTIHHLPPGVLRPPVLDLLVLSVRDGNAWITRDYDLRHLPAAVAQLYKIGGLPPPKVAE